MSAAVAVSDQTIMQDYAHRAAVAQAGLPGLAMTPSMEYRGMLPQNMDYRSAAMMQQTDYLNSLSAVGGSIAEYSRGRLQDYSRVVAQGNPPEFTDYAVGGNPPPEFVACQESYSLGLLLGGRDEPPPPYSAAISH